MTKVSAKSITKKKTHEKVSINSLYKCRPLDIKEFDSIRSFYKNYGRITEFLNWLKDERHITMQRMIVSKAVNRNTATNIVWGLMKEYMSINVK